jgi:hypothetical protein
MSGEKFYFNGEDYCASLDKKRLKLQIVQIYLIIKDGKWRTLPELEKETGYMSSSISAQLRNLRKLRFGALKIEKRRRGNPTNGLFEYRLNLEE